MIQVCNSNVPNDKRARIIFEQILIKNPDALKIQAVTNTTSKAKGKKASTNVHDLLVKYFYASEHSVRQVLMKNLDVAKKAVPLMLPSTELLLWPLLCIEKCWRKDG